MCLAVTTWRREKKVDEVERAGKEAFSIESCPPDSGPLEYVGMKQRGERVSLYYKDQKGRYWYKTMFAGRDGLITEEEHIFGKKRLGRSSRRKIWD